MKHLGLAGSGERLSVLCIGAHSDDIEIGAGATILGWIDRGVRLDVHWAVLSAIGPRADEARASAQQFLANAARAVIDLAEFKNGFFPYQGADIKNWFEALRRRTSPDVILCHWRHDAHQDHREVSRLTWNTFRDHAILEYEIPKWDGDARSAERVPSYQQDADGTQDKASSPSISARSATKDWFDDETFMGLARLRGMECRAPDGFAEAFHARKLTVQ